MDETPTKPPRDPSPADDPHDDDTIPNEDHPENEVRATEDDQRPRYRSWKKKWRKLRVTFDHKMHEAEVLWMQEQKAKATIKRIAIENECVCPFPIDSHCHQSPCRPLRGTF